MTKLGTQPQLGWNSKEIMETVTQDIIEWIQYVAHDPLLMAISLALATFLTEDGALIAGSLLVGAGEANASLVISALAAGIISGDIALYALGWSARTNKYLRKRLPVKKSRGLRRWLRDREATILFTSRFTPGTRLITYVTFGFLKLSIIRFTIVMTISGALWVSAMVLFISEIQQATEQLGGVLSLSIALAVGLTLIFAIPRLIKMLSPSKSIHDAEAEYQHAR